MELVMGRLKGCQSEISREGDKALRLEIRQMEQELEQREIQGLLERRERRVRKAAIEMMEGFARALEGFTGMPEGVREAVCGESEADPKSDPWEQVRRLFSEASDRFEDRRENCGEALEHAFDFLEGAFGSGQELVIFVTELNASPACLHFLKEYDCPRYVQYNRSLLFEDLEQEMRKQMDELKGNQI